MEKHVHVTGAEIDLMGKEFGCCRLPCGTVNTLGSDTSSGQMPPTGKWFGKQRHHCTD